MKLTCIHYCNVHWQGIFNSLTVVSLSTVSQVYCDWLVVVVRDQNRFSAHSVKGQCSLVFRRSREGFSLVAFGTATQYK